MLDLLHGTVSHTISIISVTLVFSSAASKLNYFVEHTSLVVSAPGLSVNSAIEMTVLLLLLLLLLCKQKNMGLHFYNFHKDVGKAATRASGCRAAGATYQWCCT